MTKASKHIRWYSWAFSCVFLFAVVAKGLHGLVAHHHVVATVACDGTHEKNQHWHQYGHEQDDCSLCEAVFMPFVLQNISFLKWLKRPITTLVVGQAVDIFTQNAFTYTTLRGPPAL